MMRIHLIFTFLFATVVFLAQSQTVTNVEALSNLAEQFAADWQASQVRVSQYAKDHNVPVRQQLEDGRTIEMVDVVDGKPVYYATDNFGAAQTTRVVELWEGGNTGLDMTGEGYNQLGEWDAGAVRKSHQEFTDQGASRVTQMDGNPSTNYHATHVAGTMVAAGVSASAKGMAFQANLKAYEWGNDVSEMAAAAANGLELSNHSYGTPAGWENYGSWTWLGNPSISATEDYKFGFYDNTSRQMDQIAYNAPYYLICRSAGNERGEGPGNAGTGGNPEIDGGPDGYDCISPVKLGKNILSVGAVREVTNYSGPGSVIMSSFSSWGPADDGRIKPDIVGKGVEVFSTLDDNNSAYGTLSGTSMSTPNVTGSLALLQHYYQSIHDTPMLAATLKGLAIHTADEAGAHEGPDYIFGWGLMNAERAANKITEDTIQDVISELLLEDGDTYSRQVNVPEGSDLRVTICWTDVPGIPVAPALDPRDPMLVNNLQLTVSDEDGNTYFPYSLDPENPSLAATNDSENNVDNVEMVYAKNLGAGTYTITVSHEGELEMGEQAFSMIITGIDEYTLLPLCTDVLLFPQDGATDVLLNQLVQWEPAQYATTYDVYFGTDGEGLETPVNIINGENIPVNSLEYYMEPTTTYYLQVIPRNSYGAATGCSTIWSFTTLEGINEYPYMQDAGDADVPELPFLWQANNLADARWESVSQVGHNDNRSMLCYNPEGLVETNYDNWLISPPFSMVTGKEYKVSFYFRNIMPGHPETMTVYWGNMPYPEDLMNVLSSHDQFDFNEWTFASGLIVPEEDGLIYLAWHAESLNGLGIFLDDIMVEDFGTVGIDGPEKSDLLVYARSGSIVVSAAAEWQGSEIRILNLMGQEVSRARYAGGTQSIDDLGPSGIYLVNLVNGNRVETKKVLMR